MGTRLRRSAAVAGTAVMVMISSQSPALAAISYPAPAATDPTLACADIVDGNGFWPSDVSYVVSIQLKAPSCAGTRYSAYVLYAPLGSRLPPDPNTATVLARQSQDAAGWSSLTFTFAGLQSALHSHGVVIDPRTIWVYVGTTHGSTALDVDSGSGLCGYTQTTVDENGGIGVTHYDCFESFR
jgi:hypothetical protein